MFINQYTIMKKITLFLMLIGMITLQSCNNDDPIPVQIDNDTISEVIEITNVNFTTQNNFSALVTINPPIFNSDMILVYRLDNVINGQDVWRLLPQTYFFGQGAELDYNFDFTTTDVSIFIDANFNPDTAGFQWTRNQIFRIVIIPGFFGNRMAFTDFSNYNATIEQFGLKDKPIRQIKL
jgi:hypothetical protein